MSSPRPVLSEHPDAKLVIRSTSSTLELELHAPDGTTPPPFGPIPFKRDPDAFFKELFSEIEDLPVRDRTPREVHREMEDLGAELSKRLLPQGLGQLLAEIRADRGNEPRTLWIQSDEPWIPWELLRLPSSFEDRGFQGPFLGEAFAVARWLRVSSHHAQPMPSPSLPLQNLTVVAPRDSGLGVESEVAFLEGLRGDRRDVETIPAEEDTIRRELGEGRHDAWHFSGHGLAHDDPTRAEMLLDSGQLRPRGLHAGLLEPRRPLVFLNACHTGRTGFSLTGIGGWAEAFLNAGAGAFLGAYWAIEDEPAARFTEVFYTAFLDEGLPIAEAVRRARLAIRDEFPGDPTWLAYTLFAHPLAHCEVARDPVKHESAVTVPPTKRSPVTGLPRSRRRRGLDVAVAAAVLLATLAAVLTLLFWPSPPPSVAVLGFVNQTGSSEDDWLTTAASEMLTTALALDGKIRVVPGEIVARSRSDLELGKAELLDANQARRLFEHLGVSYLVHGSLNRIFSEGERRLKIDLRLYELPGGDVEYRFSFQEVSDEELRELIFDAARRLHREIGAGELEEDRKIWLEEIYPTDHEALELYVAGLSKLWHFDDQGARDDLERAASRMDEHPLIQMKLANAFSNLGDVMRSREAARKAHDQRERLPRREKLEVEARFHHFHGDDDATVSSYQELRGAFPHNPEYGVLLAEAQINAGSAPEALTTLDELRQLPLSSLQRGECDLLETQAYLALDDLTSAQEAVARAVEIAHEIGAHLLEAQARFHQAEVFELTGEYQEAVDTLTVAKRIFETELKSPTDVWNAFSKLAIILYWQGGVEAAEAQFAEYEEQYRRREDPLGEALSQGNLGLVMVDLGEYDRAEAILTKALPRLAELGRRRDEAIVANGLGFVYQLSGQLAQAKEKYQQALEIFKDLGQDGQVALITTNLGEIAFLEGRLDEASDLHRSALEINRELGDVLAAAYDRYRLGMVRTATGNFDEARADFTAALDASADDAETKLAFAELEIAMENYSVARQLAEEAEQVFGEAGMDDAAILAQILQARVELASAQGDPEEVREIVQRTRTHAEHSEDNRVRIAGTLLAARLAVREADAAALEKTLETLVELAEATREVPYQLEIRLVQAEVERASGRIGEARRHLEELAAEAGKKGFAQIEKRAGRLLDELG